MTCWNEHDDKDLRFFQFPMPVKAVQVWEVIGGAISGGLLVRTGKGLGGKSSKVNQPTSSAHRVCSWPEGRSAGKFPQVVESAVKALLQQTDAA